MVADGLTAPPTTHSATAGDEHRPTNSAGVGNPTQPPKNLQRQRDKPRRPAPATTKTVRSTCPVEEVARANRAPETGIPRPARRPDDHVPGRRRPTTDATRTEQDSPITDRLNASRGDGRDRDEPDAMRRPTTCLYRRSAPMEEVMPMHHHQDRRDARSDNEVIVASAVGVPCCHLPWVRSAKSPLVTIEG